MNKQRLIDLTAAAQAAATTVLDVLSAEVIKLDFVER